MASHFLPLHPPVCYISALVLSCSLTFLVLTGSLVTHRSVAGSDPHCGSGEEVSVLWAYRTPDSEGLWERPGARGRLGLCRPRLPLSQLPCVG